MLKCLTQEKAAIGIEEGTPLVRATGCQNCNNTGYSGREGIFEIMPVTNDMKNVIQKESNPFLMPCNYF